MRRLVIDGLLRNRVDAVSAALWSCGAAGVQEDWMPGTAPPPRQPWDEGPPAPLPDRVRVLAWFEEPEPAEVIAALGRWLDASTSLAWHQEPEVDWVQRYEDSLERLELPGVTLAPPHLAQPGDLIIDPGCGFGTGEHPTTRQLLSWLPELSGSTLLDIGSGSGILALAAARRGFRVHGTEIEEPALRAAARNAELNGLDVSFDDRQPAQLAPADVVLANLHAELLEHFASDLRRLATRELLCAGILAEKEDRVRAAFAGRPLKRRELDGEWVALWFGGEP